VPPVPGGLRVSYYTGQPVDINEVPDDTTGKLKLRMGRIELGDHEAHRAQRVLDGTGASRAI